MIFRSLVLALILASATPARTWQCSTFSVGAHAPRTTRLHRMQLFPGDDPLDFVRQEARRKAAEHMAMEEAEGNPKSDTFKKMYADALEEVEVEEYLESLNGFKKPKAAERDEDEQRRRVAALDDPWQETEEAAPAQVDERERVLQEIEAAGGVTADSAEQQEVFFALPDGFRSALAWSGSRRRCVNCSPRPARRCSARTPCRTPGRRGP